jgi:dTDP-4-dehydrorhamnose reductase
MYGRSKLEGERAVEAIDDSFLIFRTAWVYSLRRPSFVTKVLEWSRRQQTLRVVTDQVSNPTWCRSLAEATASLLARAGRNPAAWIQERKGLYHLAGWGYASRIDLAKAVLRCDPAAEEQVTEKLEPALSREFPSPVERPLFSALNCEKFEQTFDLRLPDWEKALKLAMVS